MNSLFNKKLLKYIFLIVVGLILAILLLEIILRIIYFFGENNLFGLYPLRTTIEWYDDGILGNVRLKPHAIGWFVTPTFEYYSKIESNSEGFYDYDHQVDKSDGVYRIILLGDSFVASLQTDFDNILGKQLERKLSGLTQKKVEVIAIGLGDTGTAQQFLALKQIGLKYKPDLVVHLFLTANDLKNNSPGLQKDQFRPYFQLDENDTLVYKNYVIKSQDSNYEIKKFFKKLRIVELILILRQNALERQRDNRIDYPIDYHIYDNQLSSEYEKSLKVTKKILLEEKKITEENGAKYLMITLANNEQVNGEVLKDSIDLEKPDKLIQAFYTYDGHWNEIGTSLAVEFLAKNLKGFIEN